MKTMMFLLVHAILFGMLYQHAEGTGHFYGGSMSYAMEKQSDGNHLVNSFNVFFIVYHFT
jgi:hypothetical protein